MSQTVLYFDQNLLGKCNADEKKNHYIEDNMDQVVLPLIQFLKCI